MNDITSLSSTLSAIQFAMWELHLYLSSHPDDISALKLYSRYEERYKSVKDEYESKFGALSSNEVCSNVPWAVNSWLWASDDE